VRPSFTFNLNPSVPVPFLDMPSSGLVVYLAPNATIEVLRGHALNLAFWLEGNFTASSTPPLR
jgi:hypothetical protein